MTERAPARPGRGTAKWPGPVLFVVILLVDLVTKEWALATIPLHTAIEITDFFNLVLVWNTGVSFGLFQSGSELGRWLLIGLALAICTILGFWVRREERFWPRIAIWLILAGALGNVADRIRFGAVVDFLDFHAFGYHWPAFNVADSMIVVGALTLLVDSLFAGSRPPAHEEKRG